MLDHGVRVLSGIRTRPNPRVSAIDAAHNRQNGLQQDTKFSRILFVVITASLLCWFPGIMVYFVYYLSRTISD